MTTSEPSNTTNDNEDDDNYDDSESFQTSNKPKKTLSGTPTNRAQYDPVSDTLKLKQITKMISPKWPNRVFAVELIRRIIQMCASQSINDSVESPQSVLAPGKDLKQLANFDLNLAKKLKAHQVHSTQIKNDQEANYLIFFLQDIMRISCIAASGSCDMLKLAGLDLLNDLIMNFAHVEEPNPEFKGHLILEQYQAQVIYQLRINFKKLLKNHSYFEFNLKVSAALRPQFSIETSAHVTAKACQVCSMWISSGIARDLNDLRRVHQLLVSSLQKLTNNTNPPASSTSEVTQLTGNTAFPNMLTNSDNLIYSELSLTVEKLAVLRAWAEVYIVAQKSPVEKCLKKGDNTESLLGLVQPELALLSHHWSVALKDYAYLSLPNGKFISNIYKSVLLKDFKRKI